MVYPAFVAALEQDVVYVHVLFTTLKLHVAPPLAEHAVHPVHFA